MAFGLFHMGPFCAKTLKSAEGLHIYKKKKKKKKKAMQYLHTPSRVWSGGPFTLSAGTPLVKWLELGHKLLGF